MRDNSHLHSAHILHGKRIGIVGAGPAGLTFARLLQMQDIEVNLFESDASLDARDQGGSLDLHVESGQLALRRAGLWKHFELLSRPEGQAAKIFDRHGNLVLKMQAGDEAERQPEIDRGALRRLLNSSLRLETITWHRRLSTVEQTDDGCYRLDFKEGSSTVVDVVVGCDGTWSKVRPLLSPVQPQYGGVTFIETRLAEPDVRVPALSAMVGQGAIMALGDNRALMAQRNGDGDIRVYIALRVPEDWVRQCGWDFSDHQRARSGLLGLFTGWSATMLDLLRFSENRFIPRPLYTFPPEQVWNSVTGVTLLGDAAHVMPPFTGKGANYAMLDAVELADALTSGFYPDIASALGAYQRVMLTRMESAIAETLASQDLIMAPDAPAGFLALEIGQLALQPIGRNRQPEELQTTAPINDLTNDGSH